MNTAQHQRMRERSISGLLQVMVVSASWLLLGAACSSFPDPTILTAQETTPPASVILAPGAEIEVTCFGAPDLTISQSVRPDGKISLRLVGDVMAAGLTPEQLQKDISQLYETQLQIKSVLVRVISPGAVIVAGSVFRPGRIELTRNITVLEAVMEAGGFNEMEAETRSVLLIRHDAGKRSCYVFDMSKALLGRPDDKGMFLRSHDIVYVPRTVIVKVDQWVEQHINRMIPRVGVGYTTEAGAVFVP